MDWLICVGGGIIVGILCMLVQMFSRWTEDAIKGGAYKRRDW
jgi:hypothetical protein